MQQRQDSIDLIVARQVAQMTDKRLILRFVLIRIRKTRPEPAQAAGVGQLLQNRQFLRRESTRGPSYFGSTRIRTLYSPGNW